MEKYGTYHVFKHKTTGTIKKLLFKEGDGELEKIASDNNWEEIFYDPDFVEKEDGDIHCI